MAKVKKREKKQETAEEFAVRINKQAGVRNGSRRNFAWKKR